VLPGRATGPAERRGVKGDRVRADEESAGSVRVVPERVYSEGELRQHVAPGIVKTEGHDRLAAAAPDGHGESDHDSCRAATA